MKLTFKNYLLEYAMGEKTLSKATTIDAKVGFEFEICLDPSNVGYDMPEITKDVDSFESFDDLDKEFNLTKSERRGILSEFDDWLDEKRTDYVDDNFEDYMDDDTEEYDAMDKAATEFNKKFNYDIDDFISEKYSIRRGTRRIDWLTFINDFALSPPFGWENAKAGIIFVDDPDNVTADIDDIVRKVADKFSSYMGISYKDIDSSGGYHDIKRTGSNWIVETDSSIEAKSGDVGIEVVSPPLEIDNALTMFKKSMSTFKKLGAYTNKSTGLHINVSLKGKPEIDFLKLVLLMGEENELKKYNRELNPNAKSHIKQIIDSSKKYMAMMDSDMDIKDIKDIIHSFSTRMITGKYASFNFEKYEKDGYIEFRVAGGNYLDMSPTELMNTIKRFVIVLSIAASKEEAQKDYYKKVYKLLQDVIHSDAPQPPHETRIDGSAYPNILNITKKIPGSLADFKHILSKSAAYPNSVASITKDTYNFLLKVFKFMNNAKLAVDTKQANDFKRFVKDYSIDINSIKTMTKGKEILDFFKL